jgi:uncharacterized protein YecE (DUF72 family)
MDLDLSPLPENLYAGTSSFSSKDWQGVFYPEGTRPADYLAEYGKRFRTVEIDSTFYGAPLPRTVDGWAEKTGPGFIMSAKAPQSITHEKELVDCEEETLSFLETMSRLGEKLGPLVFQFPYLPKGKDPEEHRTGARFRGRLARFLELLPRTFRYAVEVRNSRWLDRELLDLLAAHQTALVLADHPTMPSLADIERSLDPLTTDFAFIRFLGDRKAMDRLIEEKKRGEGKEREFDRLIMDRAPEMRSWVPALKRLLPRTRRTFVYFNNHYAGFGPGSVALFARTWLETS